jgi:hypothetical protein
MRGILTYVNGTRVVVSIIKSLSRQEWLSLFFVLAGALHHDYEGVVVAFLSYPSDSIVNLIKVVDSRGEDCHC